MADYAGKCNQAIPTSTIDMAINDMVDALKFLNEQIGTLQDRVSPVLGPEGPEKPGILVPHAPEASCSPIADRLHNITGRIREASDTVANIRNRVEL